MSAGEVYTALERGTIDATEWVGPLHDLRLGLNRAARYYYYPGWHEPGTELELLINKARWDKLPADLQEIVKQAAAATSAWTFSALEYLNSQALKELSAKKNVQVLQFPAQVMQELRAITTQTLEQEAEKTLISSACMKLTCRFRKHINPGIVLPRRRWKTDAVAHVYERERPFMRR